MTEQVGLWKVALKNKRFELTHNIRSQRAHLSAGEPEHDLMDQMLSMSRRDQAVTLLDSLSRTLEAVDAALLAMKEGRYGICVECGEPIAPRRLQAIPWASHCIGCQEMLDRGPMREPVRHVYEAA